MSSYIEDSTTHAIVTPCILDLDTPMVPMATVVKNQHSNNILDKGHWCENCFWL